MAINLHEIVKQIKNGERYLGLIIYGPPMFGKTSYLQKFIQKSEFTIEYVDCLEFFEKYEDPSKILKLSPKTFFDFIKDHIDQEKTQELIIIDHVDVIFNIWSKQKQSDFIGRAVRIEKSSYNIPIITLLNSTINDEYMLSPINEISPKRIINFKELEVL